MGALYTQPSPSTNVVNFVQSEDTFTLATPVKFTKSSLGTGSTAVTLASVPSQISVQAFGRCAAGVAVTLAAGNISAQTPNSSFLTAPGYMVNIIGTNLPNTSYPFSLYTLAGTTGAPSGSINAAAVSSTTLTCYNDGWVWHRGR